MVRRLKKAGHEVAVAANFGLQASIMPWEDTIILPASYDAYGNDILPSHFAAWTRGEPAWMITLYDVWPYQKERFRDFPVASWTPVDHYPAPPAVVAWAKEHETIAMSRYGQDELAKAGVTSTYIPHAIDRSVFTPADKLAARERLRWGDDRFVVLINAANKGNFPPRKAWSEMFGALSVFMTRHADVITHLHAEPVGFQSLDLMLLANAWHIDTKRLLWSQPYRYKTGSFDQSDLVLLYSGADVLLASSMGEGFGIPTIEAQACGTPVIVSDFSASPELLGAGWKVDVQPYWDPAQSAFFGMPIINSILEALESAYAARGDPELKEAAIRKAADYDADSIFETLWLPYLASLEEKLAKPNREHRRKRRAA